MTVAPPNFARARLDVEGGTRIECWLNPTTLQLTRTANYRETSGAGQSVASLEYLGGDAEALSVELVLHAEDARTGADVRQRIETLQGLLEPTEEVPGRDQGRPKTVSLVWGQFVSFLAVCESVDVVIELFEADGTPLRAIVTLRLVQFAPDPGQSAGEGQNPTTRALQRRRQHTIRRGDTLASIAYAHLHDPMRWREIAEANELDDPLKLVPGERLTIPLGAA
ncbi:MAG TPA: LysM peptidoglycan-binding domain-containing protein [Solirubrobacteraceae bacterium]|nr:LysM peptidoglycan-binding domain-containing protein [Solirubrobacteraceae bacterium]